ncbi:lipoyl protein ligase domain-containing protein [Entomohabitans teleogrylli]|uniref:lipoyl protein ligase domain-containing protein n=1 Tax=Entomohabitans teleogrylli TaxID=1384589 RepID=UPI00073D5A84
MNTDTAPIFWPQRFLLPQPRIVLCPDPTSAEQPLIARASAGEAVAQIWQAPQGLVVPGSYRRFAGLQAACADFAAWGWPVWLRRSGGGLVPQGKGIINLSLAWPINQPLGDAAEPVYLQLCALIQRALKRFGVVSHFQSVTGSFCDGRYNLACGQGEHARKIVGTAQYWRPLPDSKGHVVLAHAVILVTADLIAAHHIANAFEAAINSGRRYDVDKTVTLAALAAPRNDLQAQFCGVLAELLGAAPA